MREKIASWWDESKGCLVFAVCAALALFLGSYFNEHIKGTYAYVKDK